MEGISLKGGRQILDLCGRYISRLHIFKNKLLRDKSIKAPFGAAALWPNGLLL